MTREKVVYSKVKEIIRVDFTYHVCSCLKENSLVFYLQCIKAMSSVEIGGNKTSNCDIMKDGKKKELYVMYDNKFRHIIF